MRRRAWRWLLLAGGLPLTFGAALYGIFSQADLPALTVPPQEDFELRHVTLIIPGAGPHTEYAGMRKSGLTVRIAAGRITAIFPDLAPGAFGGYVLPGLIDAHVHSPFLPGDHRLLATLYLLHGVTTVRNLGDGMQSLKRKTLFATGREASPRVYSCGVHLDGSGKSLFLRAVKTRAEAQRTVKELKAAGADCIKVLPHFSSDTFAALRESAHAARLPIVGHMVNAYGERGLFESGIADVQHFTGVPQAESPGFDEEEWRRFHASFDTLTAERIAETVAVSRRLGIIHTPTLVGSAYATQDREEPTDILGLEPRIDLLPPWYGRLWAKLDRSRRDDDRAQAQRNFPRYLTIVRALHQSGVAIQAGSDAFPLIPYVVPGKSLHEELALLVRAGLSPEESLAAATVVPGSAISRGELPGLGTLRVGGPADLLLFRQDPTDSLVNLDSLETVVADGRRYPRANLLSQLEVQLAAARRFPYAFAGRLLGWLLSVFA